MRKTLILAVALAIGCGDGAVVPLRVPTEVSVTLSNEAGDTTATALGDSVVVRATIRAGCGGTVSARAGREGGTLVVTVTDSLEFPVPCALLAPYRTYRAAAGPLRSGVYPVAFRFRDVVGSAVSSSTLTRTTVAIP